MNRNSQNTPVDQKSDVVVDDKRFQTILKQLESCEGLVAAELDSYQNASAGAEPSVRTDYLLSVVIPVYNEEATIARVISRVAALPLNTEIIVVDDCSTDRTREILGLLSGIESVNVILKDVNAGKGAAIRTGFEAATGDFLVIQDADLEYDPRDIPQLIQPLLKGEADIVYGSRFIGDEVQDESFIHRLGNAVLTGASNLFSGLKLTDMETCYKAFSKEAINAIEIEQERFGVEPEMTAKLARCGFKFAEVPISYDSRGYDEGKKIGVKDLINAVYCIGRYGVRD